MLTYAAVQAEFKDIAFTPALMRDLAALDASGSCQHLATRMVWSTFRNGTRHVRAQCKGCGKLIGGAQPRLAAPPDAPDEDVTLRERSQQANLEALRRVYLRHRVLQAERRAAHESYLKSPTWRAKRAKVMARAQGLCEGCREATAREVHHLTYEHWGAELLFELVALCEDCHERCHQKEADDAAGA